MQPQQVTAPHKLWLAVQEYQIQIGELEQLGALPNRFMVIGGLKHMAAKLPQFARRMDEWDSEHGVSLSGEYVLGELLQHGRHTLTDFLIEGQSGKEHKAMGAVADGQQGCLMWLFKGRCSKGADCKFQHSAEDKGLLQAYNKVAGSDSEVCWRWARYGECQDGASFKRQHPDLPACILTGLNPSPREP